MARSKKIDVGANVLTLDDLLSGGEEAYRALEIPEIVKNGKPSCVYLRSLPAGDVLDYGEMPKDQQNAGMLRLIAKAVVSPEGEPLFSENDLDKMRKVSIKVFNRLMAAVMGDIAPPLGATPTTPQPASDATPGAGSPTDSPSN